MPDRQRTLFPLPRERDPHPEPPKPGDWHFDFDLGDECAPRTLDEVPEWLRLPGEPGHVELDRFGRRVGK